MTPRSAARLCVAALLAAWLAGCGGGGDAGGGGTPTGLVDTTPYSTAGGAFLASADEAASVTTHTVTVSGAPIAYTATAGHVNARAPVGGAPEASMFYVAYTVPAMAGPNRPIIYFYNGGPGSATVWLHLGSFAPRRVVTHAPSTTVPLPQLVDNAESLIDVADLVFVDAVGTGYSEAIAPFLNQSFWSVDGDAGLMRDFIARYAAVNQRLASPTYLFGESYGTTRSAVLAHLMVAAAMRLDGVVLQSSVLDYNSNCDVNGIAGAISCEGSFPSYGMVGAWFSLTHPVPTDADAYAQQLRDFSAASYGPAATAWVKFRQPAAPALLNQLVDLTGAPLDAWTTNVDLDATTFRSRLLTGQLIGRYDARIAAPNGSALAAGGDPSSTLVTAPFTAAARSLFTSELQYTATATYTLLSNAINSWDFSHDGRNPPDTIPDLAAAITLRPSLKVLSLAGYHDLATPFHQTELDTGRLGAKPGLALRVYPGGHMTYLDDGSRPRIKADVAAMIAAQPPMAVADSAAMARQAATESPTSRPSASPLRPARIVIGSPIVGEDRSAFAQGGDPYLPPALRVAPSAPSPSGAALKVLVERKIAERRADVYR